MPDSAIHFDSNALNTPTPYEARQCLVNLQSVKSRTRRTKQEEPKYTAESILEGGEKGLGSYANNVEKVDRDPVKASTIHSIKKRNWKPNRYRNHEIKRNLSLLGLSEKRTKDCGCKTIGKGTILSIDTRHGNARSASIETCGSAWACPTCRDKIMSERSTELTLIGEEWKRRGGRMLLLTLTFPHLFKDNLSEMLGSSDERTGLKGAVKRFRQSYYWREMKEKIGYEADCRSLEITYGENGFHPHIHMLIYHKKGVDNRSLDNIKDRLYQNWRDACIDAGLKSPNYANGLDIRNAKTTDYIAKWGMVQELSSGHRKKAKKQSLTIPEMEFKLLELPLQNPKSELYQRLLYMYYRVLKGSKVLTWGGQKKGEPSFKKRMVGEEEKSDLDLATIQKEELQYLWAMVEIPSSQWQSIYWRGHSADIKTVLERGGLSLLHKWAKINGYDVSEWHQLPDDYYQKIADEKKYAAYQWDTWYDRE